MNEETMHVNTANAKHKCIIAFYLSKSQMLEGLLLLNKNNK